MKNLIFCSLILFVILSSCKKETPMKNMQDDDPGVATDTIGDGSFTSFAHSLSGEAILYSNVNGDTILRLQNFNMTAGPDVYVFLSTTSSYNTGAIQVGQLAVNTDYTNSNINFSVSGSAYTAAHRYVLIYCVQYSSLFGYADLQ